MAIRAPRIMQRKRTMPYDRSQVEPVPSTSISSNIVDDDIDEVLDSSGVYIQDGVMMRIQDTLNNEERRILAEESAYAAAERFHMATKNRRSITVDDSTGFGDSPQPYFENRLPGIADEVESYPCRVCDRDQVFLTGFGLEKHTRNMHPDHLSDVLRQIRIIGEEWKRRNLERGKIKERVQAVRYRHDSLAMAAAKELRMGSTRNMRRWNPDGSYNYVIRSNELDVDIMGNTPGIIGSAGGPFQACTICNLQINVSHPIAHETHLKAHKRNDELRESLLQEYGHEHVERMSCHDCQLVFTDQKKLLAHNESMHVRKRKFVCKWCGFVTCSVTELNEHKIDVHAMPPNGGPRQAPIMSMRKEGHFDTKNGEEKNKNNVQEKKQVKASAPTPMADESHFSVTRTSCPDCSLPFNRPSLLLKHMLRVHSKCTFTASIDTKGLPSFTVQVDRGRVTWSCCGRDFNDRVSFSHHRQSHSVSAVNEDELIPIEMIASSSRGRVVNIPSPQEEVVVSSESIKGAILDDEYHIDQNAIIGADGTIEIVVPQGMKNDGSLQYILVVEPDKDGVERQKIVAFDPRDDPEDLLRQHGMSVGGGEGIESSSQEGMDGANYLEDENGQIIMSSEQFEQFTMQYGDISNLNIVYVENSHENRIEDGNEGVNEEREEEEDTNALQHDILEPSES